MTNQIAPRPRVPVVVVIEPDGLVRAFGPDQVDVRFVGILQTSAQSRTDAEEYSAMRLPLPHKEIAFDARYSRGIYWPCVRTPEEELQRVIELSLVRECGDE